MYNVGGRCAVPKPYKPIVLTPEAIQRFWSRVDTSGECWPWTTQLTQEYPQIWVSGQLIGVHRVAYAIQHGSDPGPYLVCHTCDLGRCCRGEHLFRGDHWANTNDMVQKKRAASGDRHWTRQHPERRVRPARKPRSPDHPTSGDRHWTRRMPERVPRGAAKSLLGTTEDDVRAIRARYAQGGISLRNLGLPYHLSPQQIHDIVHHRRWAHVL